MTITANYFMTIFGVVLVIGFLIASWLLNRDQSDRYRSRRESARCGAFWRSILYCIIGALVVGVAFAALTARTDCFATFETLIALAAGSYSFAVAFRRHLERTIK